VPIPCFSFSLKLFDLCYGVRMLALANGKVTPDLYISSQKNLLLSLKLFDTIGCFLIQWRVLPVFIHAAQSFNQVTHHSPRFSR
jgi:hypothetical protein